MSPGRRPLIGLLLAAVLFAGCGDDASPTTTGGSTVPPAPTEVRFTADGLTGSSGATLVAQVFDGSGALLASACLPVAADPFSAMAVAATSAPDDPCNHEPPYGALLDVAGVYSWTVGVYVPGEQVASACASGEVTVDGPTEIMLTDDDFGACAG
jgi:hypothetical protein